MTEQTRWRLVAVPDMPQRLSIDLTVASTAPAVVAAIEEMARANGVQLERVASVRIETERGSP